MLTIPPVEFKVVDFDPSAEAPVVPEFYGHAARFWAPTYEPSSLSLPVWVFHIWGDRDEWGWVAILDRMTEPLSLWNDEVKFEANYWIAVNPSAFRRFELSWHERTTDAASVDSIARTRDAAMYLNPNDEIVLSNEFDEAEPLTWPRLGGWPLRAKHGEGLFLDLSFPANAFVNSSAVFPPQGERCLQPFQVPGLVRPWSEYYRPVFGTAPGHIFSYPEPLI